mgnify:CR=1 FL=1
MHTKFVKCDSNGQVLHAGTAGIGFSLVPACSTPFSATERPGSYPVKVVLDGGKVLDVVNGDVHFLDAPFRAFDLANGDANEFWLVTTFETRGEGIIRAPGKQRVTYSVQTSAAVPFAVPVGAVGIKVRPGTLAHSFYFSGATPGPARIWIRTAGGEWFDTGEDLDPTDGAGAFDVIALTRNVTVAGDRLYLQSGGLGLSVAIDATCEVG